MIILKLLSLQYLAIVKASKRDNSSSMSNTFFPFIKTASPYLNMVPILIAIRMLMYKVINIIEVSVVNSNIKS